MRTLNGLQFGDNKLNFANNEQIQLLTQLAGTSMPHAHTVLTASVVCTYIHTYIHMCQNVTYRWIVPKI